MSLLSNRCVVTKKLPTDSGHPALSIPVGFVPAKEDANVKLPAGLQLVGRKYSDVDCLKVAAAWENAYDWKTL